MMARLVAWGVLLLLGLGGCAGDSQSQAQAKKAAPFSLPQGGGWQVTRGPQEAAPTKVPEVDPAQVTDPDSAQYTILCRTLDDRMHDMTSKKVKALLLKNGLKHGYIVHREKESALYYGLYADRGVAERDLKKIVELTDSGRKPFAQATVTELNPADPPAPKEWDLRNSKGYWSLQIAAFQDHPNRKQAAVEAVQELRAKNVPAFFFHGPTISSVCIGAWPRQALRQQNTDVARTSEQDSYNPVLVSNVPLGQLNVPNRLVDKQTGRDVKTYSPKIEIADPTLIQTMQAYPDHFVNYEQIVRVDKNSGQRVKDASFLVVVPGAEEAWQASRGQGPVAQPQPQRSPVPPSVLNGQSTPKGGTLKGIND